MVSAPALDSVLDSVRPLIEAGAAIHWLVPFEKRPIAIEWSTAPIQSEVDLRASYRKNANVGIRLGEPSSTAGGYLHIIDLDIRDAGLTDSVWSTLLTLWPAAKSFPRVISGSGGNSRHIYFLSDKAFRKKKLASGIGFEIVLMGTGSQAVIPPSIHPDTKLPYAWERPLDLDFPMLMSVDSSIVEGWGVETVAEDSDDEDDLFDLVRREPLGLEPAEIDDVLSNIPNSGEGAHYDDYVQVGMALHHEYRGSNEGFERWCEWAKQSSKFNARNAAARWRSFSQQAKTPVRMATLIQMANTNKLASELDLDDGFGPTAIIPQTDLSDLLDGAPQPAAKAATNEIDPEWLHKLHRNEEGELKSTLPNVALIINNDPRTHGIAAFNEFSQSVVLKGSPKQARKKRDSGYDPVNLDGRLWSVSDNLNGDNWTDSHDAAVRALIESKSQLKGYGIKVSDRDLRAAVDMAAQKSRFHPVKDIITSVKWDGKCRAETMFIDYLGCDDTPYYRQAALLTLIGAVARVFEPGHKFDFVPILEGVQGKGKSTFIKILGLHWMNELTGDISDPKQMVEAMQGSWVLEIGELSSMARAEVNDLKSFVSRTVDKVRLAWERRVKDFPRQCIFIGSTNDREYLRDQTGGRRFWPIVCQLVGQIDNPKFERNVMQIWAEAVHIYHEMRVQYANRDLPLFLTDEAATMALDMQESRRVETAEEMLSGKITAWLEHPIGTDERFDDLDPEAPKSYRNETCVAQIWEEMLNRDTAIPHTEAIKIGKAMLHVGWDRSQSICRSYEINKKYGPCRVYFRPGTVL